MSTPTHPLPALRLVVGSAPAGRALTRFDGGEHGVGPVRQPAVAYHPDCLRHRLADGFPGPDRCHRKRNKHSLLLSLATTPSMPPPQACPAPRPVRKRRRAQLRMNLILATMFA